VKFETRVLEQVEKWVTKLEEEMRAKLEEEMRAKLDAENMKNWEKMMEYMALHYLAPHFGPFGSRFPPSTFTFICIVMYLLL
jgi:L-fucose isomerase-like protein